MPKVALLAIGNELLNGDVQDTNLHTLNRRLTQLGFQVECAALVRDTPGQIAAALHWLLAPPQTVEAFSWDIDLLVISGGLGPTQDDLTLAALAQALELPLAVDLGARRLVETQYTQLLAAGALLETGPEAARRKMATLPLGAVPLPNPIGTAPGVRLEYNGVLIYCLPGVPAELLAIFTTAVEPELKRNFALGGWFEMELVVICDDEARVALPLREVTARHPDVYLKSLARSFPAAHQEGLRIIAAAQSPETAMAQEYVSAALADLRQVLARAGIKIK